MSAQSLAACCFSSQSHLTRARVSLSGLFAVEALDEQHIPARDVFDATFGNAKVTVPRQTQHRMLPASVDFARELADLGYPGFAHFAKDEPELNPAQLLVFALSQAYLDRRTTEALPWVASRYYDMDWDWVRLESKQRDLQNRLGFTLSVAKNLVGRNATQALESQEQKLRDSLLVKEDPYCNERMTTAERRWLQTHRPPEAKAWHVLSDPMPEHVTHA